MKRFRKPEIKEEFNDGIVEAQNEAIENGLTKAIEEIANEPEESVEEFATGIIVNCEKLNVREKPYKESKAIYVLDKSSEVKVDMKAHTTEDFVKVVTVSGVEGYCMSKYIFIR